MADDKAFEATGAGADGAGLSRDQMSVAAPRTILDRPPPPPPLSHSFLALFSLFFSLQHQKDTHIPGMPTAI
jgi:hypothetical protein